jgi:Undecaprenyl-phosphate glucose phosphotransferase
MHGVIPPERTSQEEHGAGGTPPIWQGAAGWAAGVAGTASLGPAEHVSSASASAAGVSAGISAGISSGISPGISHAASAPRAPVAPELLGSLVALLDLAALGGGGLMAAALLPEASGSTVPAGRVLALTCALMLGIGISSGAYAHPLLFTLRPQILPALRSAALAALITGTALLAFGAPGPAEAHWAALALPLGALGLVAGRAAAGLLLRNDGRGRGARRTVILGAGPQAVRLVRALRREDDRSLRLLGVVDDRVPHRTGWPERLAHLGPIDMLFGMIRRGEVDQVIIAFPWSASSRIADLLDRLSCVAVEIRLAPDLACPLPKRGVAASLPVLRRCPISSWGAGVKAVEDWVLAFTALAIAAVPMALISLAIRLDSRGPILFRQRRTGFNGRDIHVLKFRTMYHEAADHEASVQVREGDPRVTRVGAILRKTSLDELPQIFNVLAGDMSFVGPRPHAPGTRAGSRRFEEVVANYAARHRVKPGLTGLAQVRGWRGPTETEEKLVRRVESDLEYIENWSIWLDIVIILRTLLAVARMRNAH